MAEHTWDVTAEEVVTTRCGGTSVTLTSATTTALNTVIENAAAQVNAQLLNLTGETPEAVSTAATADTAGEAARARRLIRDCIMEEVAGVWNRSQGKIDLGESQLARAKEMRTDLRYALRSARNLLGPKAGPDPPSYRTEKPASWLDVPDGEAFG